MRTVAPAKINWTLEVLGRREDGYHEIKSLMQTIDLCDGIAIALAHERHLEVTGPHIATEDDLTLRASALFAEDTGKSLDHAIQLYKRIPVANGLGGGSSDAAAILWALDRMHATGLGLRRLSRIAEKIGSDVPFFLRGGTALTSGRGEIVEGVHEAPSAWIVVVAPSHVVHDKTRQMYQAIRPGDFTDGSKTEAFLDAIRSGERPTPSMLHNAFDRAASEVFPGLDRYRHALLAAGAPSVHLAGAGPGLFSFFADSREAKSVAQRTDVSNALVYLTRTMRARRLRSIRKHLDWDNPGHVSIW